MQKDGGLIELYANFIQDFESKLNLLSLVEIISAVVEQMVDHDKCMACLQKTKERVKVNDGTIWGSLRQGDCSLCSPVCLIAIS